MNIETALAEIDHYVSHTYSLDLTDAWKEVLAERRQIQQDLSEAQELSRIREAQIKEELDCISSFQQQLQAKEEGARLWKQRAIQGGWVGNDA